MPLGTYELSLWCVLIIVGTVMMRYVDVDAGRADAQAEDARNRGISIE